MTKKIREAYIMCQINVSCNLVDEGWAGVTPGWSWREKSNGIETVVGVCNEKVKLSMGRLLIEEASCSGRQF
mgnify:FL=1